MPLIGWSKYALDPSHIACLLGLANPDIELIAYIMCIFIVCFVIPVLIISVSYYKTWQQIKGIGDGGAQENIEWTNHKQITKMSIVVVIMFMITWSPYALVHLYAIFYPSSLVSPLFGIIPALFAKSSTAYNPIIYALINKRFRLALKKLCGCIFTRKDRQALQVHNLI
ncbi:hypothetical protein SNE40_023616 [Patella caerulea]|uniref:G-protein coupled receptors family 1 profile domain-containing protein n=1 Tax=Patella caerulea TaxID=87958 RepID=A0AAN8G004_PATCE